jgi:hypothetical protein
LSSLLIQFKLVYGPFGQTNMHSTLDFCPRPDQPGRNKCINTKGKLRAYYSTI